MANKIKVKLILELRASGMSRNLIADTRHMSRTSVSDVIRQSDEMSITYDSVKEKDEEEVYRMFYPDKHSEENIYKNPNFTFVHSELKRVGLYDTTDFTATRRGEFIKKQRHKSLKPRV